MRVRAWLLLTTAAACVLTAAQTAVAAPGSAARGGIQAAVAAAARELATAAEVSPPAGRPEGATPGGSGAGAALGVSAQSPPRRATAFHRLAVVRGEVALSERPGGPARLRVGSSTEFGSQRVLAVAARRGDWLGVVTTERPNNRLAWVRSGSRELQMRRTRWSLHADLSARALTIRKYGRAVQRMAVAIGRPGSETPTGRFAVTDKLIGSRFGSYYGCCILALSGHQPNTPPGWTGGDRLAIHGTDAPSTIGTAASAGCLRASDAHLRPMMRKLPLGTPVFISR